MTCSGVNRVEHVSKDDVIEANLMKIRAHDWVDEWAWEQQYGEHRIKGK